MESLEILVAEIANLLNKDFDFPFKERIQAACISYRATLAKQEFDKNGRWSTGLLDFVRLKLIEVDSVECCLDSSIECTVVRTENEVPAPIRTNRFFEPFPFVGTSNSEVAFTFINPEELRHILKGTRFQGNSIFYSYYGNYIYVFNFEGRKLGVRAPFANPLLLLNLLDCDGVPCKDSIDINEDMKSTIKRMVLEELGYTKLLPKDKEIRINEQNPI